MYILIVSYIISYIYKLIIGLYIILLYYHSKLGAPRPVFEEHFLEFALIFQSAYRLVFGNSLIF